VTVTLDPVQLTLGAAAVLIALGLLGRRLKRADQVLHAVSAIVNRELAHPERPGTVAGDVQRELNPNHGQSMKDDTIGVSVAIGWLGRALDELSQRVDELTEAEHARESGRHEQEATRGEIHARPPLREGP
jgi:hypothetical protein